MMKIWAVLGLTIGLTLMANLAAAAPSPAWVGKLQAAEGAGQMLVVAGVGKTTAWVSLHEKDMKGDWQEIMTTPGFIGKNGLGKTKEGDAKTPVGVYHFNRAFGIAPDPGCAFPYVQVDENMYWSGDTKEGMGYNTLVNIKDYPGLNKADSEHLSDIDPQYTYALNISWNEECIPGKGSAIFLHCLGPVKPYTGGCVAIPPDKMEYVMRRVKTDCVVIIDRLKKLSPETYEEYGL